MEEGEDLTIVVGSVGKQVYIELGEDTEIRIDPDKAQELAFSLMQAADGALGIGR